LILSPVLKPAAFFGTLLRPECLGYLAMLVAPLAGLPLLAPEVLAVGIFPLASNLLSSAEGQYTIRAHYTAALTAVLLAATVVGGRRAAARLRRADADGSRIVVGLAATTLAASLAFSPMPWSRDVFARKQFWTAAPVKACRESPPWSRRRRASPPPITSARTSPCGRRSGCSPTAGRRRMSC